MKVAREMRDVLTACALVVGLCFAASGETLPFGLCIEYSGATPPAGDPPWLTATFDDGGMAGSVDLTLQTTNLTAEEYVRTWMFNLDPDLADQIHLLEFDLTVLSGTFDTPTVSIGQDAYRADGDGLFDIKIEFSTQDGGSDHRFGVGDNAKCVITGIDTLTAGSFDFISAPDGGQGEYPTVAHLQGIDGGEENGSGWITVPEPAALSLLVLGAGMLLRRSRSRRSA